MLEIKKAVLRKGRSNMDKKSKKRSPYATSLFTNPLFKPKKIKDKKKETNKKLTRKKVEIPNE